MSSTNERKVSTAKANVAASSTPSTPTISENLGKNEKKKKSIIPRIFGMNKNGEGSSDDLSKSDVVDEVDRDLDKKIASISKTFSDRQEKSDNNGERLNLSNFELSMAPATEIQELRVFVATWNVGGKAPHSDFNLEDFLQVEGSSDIYVLGFQEIVPLSPSNVLVIEDNEPATKWLNLINQALNKPKHDSVYADSGQNGNVMGSKLLNNTNINLKEYYNNKPSATNPSGLHFFHKPSLKVLSRSLRADSPTLKSCNCGCEIVLTDTPRRLRKMVESDFENLISPRYGSCVDEFFSVSEDSDSSDRRRKDEPTGYRLVTSKQMVGIFLSVWARSELIPHVAHLRVSSVGRGIMGCFGNKGCIAISMTLYQTSFCFVCSHLASGEKEGDEVKRNLDVAEIIKSTHFPNICKNPNRRAPEKITDHDRVLWFGDLNYRVALSYEEARVLLEDNDWDSLLEKDQLNIEREEKRVFDGFKEGHIFFAPTYKYSHNSDAYAGETAKSKKKRRTPAWCDRILWRGNGIEQLSYIRGESRFSDHRPVCSVLSVEVELNVAKSNTRKSSRFRNGFSGPLLDFEHCLPQRHSFCD